MFLESCNRKYCGDNKGFTLIELLIVVAILGVLAAVVIPNVGRFIGRGEAESKETEYQNVQSAVFAMMVDNQLASLPNPVILEANRTNNMAAFPDTSFCGTDKIRDIYGSNFQAFFDKNGYILYSHDRLGDGNSTTGLVNYVSSNATAGKRPRPTRCARNPRTKIPRAVPGEQAGTCFRSDARTPERRCPPRRHGRAG